MTRNEQRTLDILSLILILSALTLALFSIEHVHPFLNKYYVAYLNSSFLNSNFFNAAMASFFGAVGGALAIRLSEKKASNNKNISRLNRSLGILISIINTLINIKRDYSDPQYNELDEIYFNYSWMIYKIRTENKKFEFHLEPQHILKEVTISNYPTKELIQNLGEYDKSGPNCFVFATQLEQSIQRLNNTIDRLNKRIEIIEKDPRPSEVKLPIYLGLKTVNNYHDGYIESFVVLIDMEIKNSLFFARKLQNLLEDIGNGKIISKNRMATINYLDEVLIHFPPDDHLANY